MEPHVQRILIVVGAVVLAAGLLWPFIAQSGLGRLPGDVTIERPHLRLYFPVVTCLLISGFLTLLIWLFRK